MSIALPIIQIAGVIDGDEAELIAGCGATHIGFPLRLPVNLPDSSEAEAGRIISGLPRHVVAVLITYLRAAPEIAAFCDDLGCRAVQLHGGIELDQLRRLRELRPDLTVFKSLVVGEGGAGIAALARSCLRYADYVDAFITDTYNPATGASGATGLAHDWAISRRLAEVSPKPVILAGGLNPGNVAEAIAATGAAGVDAHTGVEGSDGRKSGELVREFVRRAKAVLGRLHKAKT